MRTYLVAFLLSLGISALLTPMVLRIANRLHLLDAPDGDRKIHVVATPRLGGIAIAAGFFAPIVGLAFFYNNAFSQEIQGDLLRLTLFLGGGLAILILGLIDDLRGVGAWGKLTVQTAVGVALWYGGLSFDHMVILGHDLNFGLMSLPLTVLWVAGIINAMNLVDGLDGLAAGIAFFAAFSLFSIALIDGNTPLALFAAALGGSVLGFLFYNFNPALIFMGDSGSMTIGYIFAACALWSAGKRSTAVSLMLPILALGLPIFDTLFAFARRAVRGNSPFVSDRGHIHHLLIDWGLSHRQAVLVLYLLSCVLTGAAVVTRATDDPVYAVILVSLTVAVAGAIRAIRTRLGRRKTLPTEELKADGEAESQLSA
ncbi:MAG: undecaprenyl/decaprenyl-phosphate alpha-N-acetylglucosaminyl 1-phosphate transferase [Myxococcales bacterium]|nr:undecaprenyl/decaprenyl-phosphate alpha-N-acetylglucosaminyl 1-phosphate transferase [Myxococcales bacterium]